MALVGQANGQAFNGTPSTQDGSVIYNRASPGIDRTTINSGGNAFDANTAVILWNVNNSTPFLPPGNTATFQGAPGNGNYLVLNRLNPTTPGPITLDGNIVGRISAANTAPGGTISFTALQAEDIIVGPNANFNVNRLRFREDQPGTFQNVTWNGAFTTGASGGGLILRNTDFLANGGSIVKQPAVINTFLDLQNSTFRLGNTNFGLDAVQMTGSSFIYSAGATNASGSLAQAFTLAGNNIITVEDQRTLRMSGIIDGAGSIGFTGSGTTILTAANTYAGFINIGSTSTLQLGDGGTSGSLDGNINNGGTLVFNRSDNVLFSGMISGAGGVVQAGTGTTILSAFTHTYTGGTTIRAGTLQLNGFTLGSGDLTLAGGNFRAGGSGQIINNRLITTGNTGNRISVGSGASLTLSGNFELAGSLHFGSSTDTGVVEWGPGVGLINNPLQLFVDGGTLRATNSTVGAITAVIDRTEIASGATLNLGSFASTIKNLQGAGELRNDGVITTINGGNFAGVIDGTTAISVSGGTLILSGTNTYIGGTNIAANSTLQLGDGGTTGSITTNINNDGTLIFNRSNGFSYGGTIIGNGAVVQAGAGKTTLGASNSTYAGGTAILAGTLEVLGTGALGSGALTLSGGNFRAGGTATVSNQLVTSGNTGNVISAASGQTLTLTGAVNLAGSLHFGGPADIGLIEWGPTVGAINPALQLFVDGGTLRATNAGVGVITGQIARTQIASGSTLDLGGFTATVKNLQGAGELLNNGVTTTINGGTFAGAINGTTAITSTGALILTGNNGYTGNTSVTGGTLVVDGSTAASALTTVNTGAILAGSGTVGTTSIAGGTLAPGSIGGSAFGPLTVTGSLAFTSAATYLIQVSPSNAGRTNVSGTANLGGATVNASFQPGTYLNRQYTIVTATGGLGNSTFNPAVVSNNSNLNTSLAYDANNAFLNVALNFATPNGPLNTNQQNVANTLTNFFNTTGGIPMAFAVLSPAGLTQISGETATGSQQTTIDAMTQFMGVMTDPFIAGRGDPVSAGGSATSYADEAMAYAGKRRPNDALAAIYTKAPPVIPPAQRWSVWGAGFGGSQRTDGNAVVGSNDTRSSLAAIAAGADYRVSPDTLVGFALAGGGTSFSVNGFGSGRSDLFQAGAFFRHNAGPAYLTGALAYGWQDVTTDRTVTVAGIDRLRAQFNANALSGRLEGGYRFVTQGFGVTPYAAGQFTTFELPNYAEQAIVGANTFALAYAGRSVTASRSELGLRTDKSFAMQDAIVTLRGRAAWAHDFNTDRSVLATFQTLPGASFVVNGAARASEAALVTGAAEVKWVSGWSAAATFEGEFSDVTRSYAGKGAVRYAW